MGRGHSSIVALHPPRSRSTTVLVELAKKIEASTLSRAEAICYNLSWLEKGVEDRYASAALMLETIDWLGREKMFDEAKQLEAILRPHLLEILDDCQVSDFNKPRLKELFEGSLLRGEGDLLHDLHPSLVVKAAHLIVLDQAARDVRDKLAGLDQAKVLLEHADQGINEAKQYMKALLEGGYNQQIHQLISVLAERRIIALRAGLWNFDNLSQEEIKQLQETAAQPERVKAIETVTEREVPAFNCLRAPLHLAPPKSLVGFKFENLIFLNVGAEDSHSKETIDHVITHEMVHLTQEGNESEIIARQRQRKMHSSLARRRAPSFLQTDTALFEGATETLACQVTKSLGHPGPDADKYCFERRVAQEISRQGGKELLDRLSRGPGFRMVELVGAERSAEFIKEWQALKETTADASDTQAVKAAVAKWLN
jgi:hypothetical protein